jgi:hypothetical protein
MYVVVFKQHGALNCEQRLFGPYASYEDAVDALCNGDVPRLYGQGGRPWPSDERNDNGHRYVQALEWTLSAHLDGQPLREPAL